MKTSLFFVSFLLVSCACLAQPRWSPEIRSQREMAWLKDSLHISKRQEEKLSLLSITYQKEYDRAANPPNENRLKLQHGLMRKKDTDYKKILTPKQYERYYQRELRIRQIENRVYPEGRQPL